MTVRGRFAPTPSGPLHLGNAWSALLAWLQVRQQGGSIVMRIEDIDGPRSRPEFAQAIMEDLRWLGLDWDEGPDISGPYAPYTQSERYDRYEAALRRLSVDGRLYPCYCSRAELAAIASAPHGLAGDGPAYPGICRGLTGSERAAHAARKSPALRFAMPEHDGSFTDLALGQQHYAAGAGGDFIVKRADGIYAYQLAVVVDDADMGITHVLRGQDLLDSTPRQLALFKALGERPPRFAHVPLLMGPDGHRLAKRHGSVRIDAMRGAGTQPEMIIGRLAYMAGLLPEPQPVKPTQLVGALQLDRLPCAPIVLREDDLQALGASS